MPIEVWCWVVATVVLIGAAWVTRTRHPLALAAAVVVGVSLALVGVAPPTLFFSTAVVAVAFLLVAEHGLGGRTPKAATFRERDLGQRVAIERWHHDSTARVSYRGSAWDAVTASPLVPHAQSLIICGRRGDVLVLSTAFPHPAN